MFLEGDLQLPQDLDLGHMGEESRIVVRIEEMVLEDCELVRIRQDIVRAVGIGKEIVNLSRRELVTVASLDAIVITGSPGRTGPGPRMRFLEMMCSAIVIGRGSCS